MAGNEIIQVNITRNQAILLMMAVEVACTPMVLMEHVAEDVQDEMFKAHKVIQSALYA